MDYEKIGKFIMAERKAKKLTQAKLAEKLFVSEKTISKWENGNGAPDTNLLQKLCEIFEISINELLNGERITKENYVTKAEEKLLELQACKVAKDKSLLICEIVVGVLSSAIFLSLFFVGIFVEMEMWLKCVLIAFGSVFFFFGMFFALRLEQVAGYYECSKCHHKYVPKYSEVLWAMHVNRTRYLKCPHCKQKSWSKKVVE